MKKNDRFLTRFIYPCLSLGYLMLPSLVFAGGGSHGGNGGGAFICPDPKNSEFLDIFEGRTQLNLTFIPSEEEVETQIQDVFKKLNPQSALYSRIISTYKKAREATPLPVPEGYDLAWPSDAKNKYAPKGCAAKGIILYHDATENGSPDTKDIDSNSLAGLPKTQQAVAWVHETIYKFLRETQNAQDSVRARAIVAYLFSNIDPQKLNDALEPYGLRPKTGVSHFEQKTVSFKDGSSRSFLVYYTSFSTREPDSVPFEISFEADPTRDQRCKLPLNFNNDSKPAGVAASGNPYGIATLSEGVSLYRGGYIDEYLYENYGDAWTEDQHDERIFKTLSTPHLLYARQPIHEFLRTQNENARSNLIHCPYTITLSDPSGGKAKVNFDEMTLGTPFDWYRDEDLIANLALVLPSLGTITK